MTSVCATSSQSVHVQPKYLNQACVWHIHVIDYYIPQLHALPPILLFGGNIVSEDDDVTKNIVISLSLSTSSEH
jgi:hypothetical protein